MDGGLIEAAHECWRQSQLTQTIIETSDLFEQAAVAKSIDARRCAALHDLSFDSAQGYHFKRPSRQPWSIGKVDILGAPIDNICQQDLFDHLTTGVVCAPSVDQLMHLRQNEALAQSYHVADYRVCDRLKPVAASRQGLRLASKLLGQPVAREQSSLFPAFCIHHQANPDTTLFLLGEEAAQTRINQEMGREMVVGSHRPSVEFGQDEQECREIVERINQSEATVLAIAVGSPQQEIWIQQYRDRLTHIKIIFALDSTAALEPAGQDSIQGRGFKWLRERVAEPQRLWKNDLPFLGLFFQ